MKRSKSISLACRVMLATVGISGPASATERPITVVELFTSQGCSSCPPANANLIKLSNRDVLTLSFAVTYWDYLGWKDSFGRQEFTDRQAVYEPGLGQRGSYTPQMVINGTTTGVGNNLAEIQGLISKTSPPKSPPLTIGIQQVAIGSGPSPGSVADVWLVRYDPGIVEVPISRGENSGATLPHIHVVHGLTRLGEWNGSAVSYKFAAATGQLKTAIIVQRDRGGAILSAATN